MGVSSTTPITVIRSQPASDDPGAPDGIWQGYAETNHDASGGNADTVFSVPSVNNYMFLIEGYSFNAVGSSALVARIVSGATAASAGSFPLAGGLPTGGSGYFFFHGRLRFYTVPIGETLIYARMANTNGYYQIFTPWGLYWDLTRLRALNEAPTLV